LPCPDSVELWLCAAYTKHQYLFRIEYHLDHCVCCTVASRLVSRRVVPELHIAVSSVGFPSLFPALGLIGWLVRHVVLCTRAHACTHCALCCVLPGAITGRQQSVLFGLSTASTLRHRPNDVAGTAKHCMVAGFVEQVYV
jgi:hypothetical protein